LELWDYHRYPERYEARRQVIQLYYQGWDKITISSTTSLRCFNQIYTRKIAAL